MKLSLIGALGILFITLKLCGVIAWSWWLVLLPLYGGIALAAIVLLGGLLVLGLAIKADGNSIRRHSRKF